MPIYMRGPEGKKRALSFTYDDGTDQDIRFVEILNKHGMKCTFNISSGKLPAEKIDYPEDQLIFRCLTASVCKELYKGHEMAIHGLTHPSLHQLSEEECFREIYEDRRNLEEIAEYPVRGMAYPFGGYNDSVIENLKKCGIVYARTASSSYSFEIPTDWFQYTATCHHNDAKLFELADTFLTMDVSDRDMPLFYVWGHSFEFDYHKNWELIERFCEKMEGLDDVWYATNIEIYEYIHAFRELIFAIDNSFVKNPTSTTLWFELDGKLYSVAPGETLSI